MLCKLCVCMGGGGSQMCRHYILTIFQIVTSQRSRVYVFVIMMLLKTLFKRKSLAKSPI